ncbi:DExH-box ATP-dependent RNA helicase DExH17, partial [Tanacetum coccineum]
SGAFTPDMEAIVKAEQESSQCRDFVFRFLDAVGKLQTTSALEILDLIDQLAIDEVKVYPLSDSNKRKAKAHERQAAIVMCEEDSDSTVKVKGERKGLVKRGGSEERESGGVRRGAGAKLISGVAKRCRLNLSPASVRTVPETLSYDCLKKMMIGSLCAGDIVQKVEINYVGKYGTEDVYLLMQYSSGKSVLVFSSTRKGAQVLAQSAMNHDYSNLFIKSSEQQERLREASLSCEDKQIQSYILYGVLKMISVSNDLLPSMAANFAAKIIPSGVVGEDDIVNRFWNGPAYMFATKVAPAKADGCCTMVIKPAEQTPLTLDISPIR